MIDTVNGLLLSSADNFCSSLDPGQARHFDEEYDRKSVSIISSPELKVLIRQWFIVHHKCSSTFTKK